jgi:UvrD-like helicase family protein/AAA domain-containing protein
MAFLIPDNLKSRPDVPNRVRTVARALQMGLDEDVVVWYEPLYDPAGQRPDLVVLLPDSGIAVLQVLGGTGQQVLGFLRGRLRVVSEGREIEMDNPLERAEHFAEVLRQRIQAEPRLYGLRIPVGAGAVLGTLTAEEAQGRGLHTDLPLERCLLRPHLEAAIAGTGEAALLRVFRQVLGSPLGTALTDIEKDAIHEVLQPAARARKEKLLRGLLHPGTVIDQLAGTDAPTQLTIFRPPEDGDDTIRVLDRQQEAIAMSLGTGHRVIRGVAGSGKTLILVYRARFLARLFPRQRFLITCYTRSLASQFRSLLKEYPNVAVTNLHRLVYRVLRETGVDLPDAPLDDDQAARMAREALPGWPGPRYRAVFVDEAQDFGTEQLRFALELLEEPDADFVVVADAAQNIFRRRFSWRQVGIKAQGRSQILRRNYRNTAEILGFAYRFLLTSPDLVEDSAPDVEDENALIPPEAAARRGPPPELRLVEDLEAEAAEAVEQAAAWSAEVSSSRSVAVLYADGRTGGLALNLHRLLEARGVPVFWAHKTTKDQIGEAQEPVVLCSIHSAKGLEFPRVVLCGLWREEEDPESNRRLAYVGMTRATDRLVVVTERGNPLAADLAGAERGPGESPRQGGREGES